MTEVYRDNWFPAGKARVLRERVFPLVASEGGIVEVGSWEGKSTCFLARHFAPRSILAIDPFTGGVADGTTELAQERNVRDEFERNIEVCAPDQVELVATGWREREALNAVGRHSPLAFVYIDGEHTEVEVFDNVLAYFPLMAPGGVIAGDDWGNPGVRRGAEKSAATIGAPVSHEWATWWMVFR